MKAFRTEDVVPRSLDETWGLPPAGRQHVLLHHGSDAREDKRVGLPEERAVVPCGMDREAFVQPIRSRGLRIREEHESINRSTVTYRLTDRGEDAVFILLAFLRYGIRHRGGVR